MSLYSQFYFHNLTRKYIIAFGSLFDKISIVRYDSNGNEVERERVPLTYSRKEKFFYRTEQDPKDDRKISIKLPRMGFELTTYNPAPSRRTFAQRKIRATNPNDPDKKYYQYNAAPWDLGFTLYIAVKSPDDARQILEQIVPFFQPTYNITINAIPQMGIKLDVPVTLTSVSEEDNFESSFDDSRETKMTIDFNVKAFYFGPTRQGAVIREVNVNANVMSEDIDANKYFTVTTEPFSDTIPQDEITADDDYGYLTTITEYIDGTT